MPGNTIRKGLLQAFDIIPKITRAGAIAKIEMTAKSPSGVERADRRPSTTGLSRHGRQERSALEGQNEDPSDLYQTFTVGAWLFSKFIIESLANHPQDIHMASTWMVHNDG